MSPIDFSKINALVVDDQENFKDAVAFELEMLGCKVSTADNGKSAFDAFMKDPANVHLILSDIRMPEWDGHKFLQEVRKVSRQNPPFVFMTGFADLRSWEALQAGADGFISKPINLDKLTEILHKVCLPLEERWTQPPKETGSLMLQAEFDSILTAAEGGKFQLGRGGFFVNKDCGINLKEVEVNHFVKFDFKFKSGSLKYLKGVGRIRWIRDTEELNTILGCGIEFEYLSDECRQDFLDYFKSENYLRFIPGGFWKIAASC